MICPIVKLTQKLISCPSVSPDDFGCQKILMHKLLKLGFTIRKINIKDTKNFWAYKGFGDIFTFLGHTDVVPAGNINLWKYPPFQGFIKDNIIYGRGSADMKGALSAMVIAIERFLLLFPDHKGVLSFLVTSDEESKGTNGIEKVVKKLLLNNEKIKYCLVGEPTSCNRIGDIIKNGRRGSLNVKIILYGIQGHIAYPDLLDNPIHSSLPFLHDLISIQWDKGNDFFDPTSLQISSLKVDNESTNVTSGKLEVFFNLRFNNEITIEGIKNRIFSLLNFHKLRYFVEWNCSGKPFLTKSGELLDKTINSIYKIKKKYPKLSTSGGTSDGRFVSQYMGSQVVELGLKNINIHKINENIKISDLQCLSKIYETILIEMLT
ncbi:succinyl-diaminopimelate desuccinylase [Buchnera aphidicola (Kurisakia onigurumii)]|uniref:succinyl-diaminopimelate desuccinylase n=1 Tax=Buchnera aphidicola TaxID=9 RepID=UPI0031B71452